MTGLATLLGRILGRGPRRERRARRARARVVHLLRRLGPTPGVQVIRWGDPPALGVAQGRAPTDDAPAPPPTAERRGGSRRDLARRIELARRDAEQGTNRGGPSGLPHQDKGAHAPRR